MRFSLSSLLKGVFNLADSQSSVDISIKPNNIRLFWTKNKVIVEVITMSAVSRFIPFADRVLLKKIVPVAKSLGGILLPEDSVPTRNECEVIAVGPGKYAENGNLIPCSVKKGDRVLVPGFGGDHIKINNEDYLVFNNNDIIGIFQ